MRRKPLRVEPVPDLDRPTIHEAVLLGLVLVLAGCGYAGSVTSPFEPISVTIDQTLLIDSVARIEPGSSPGIWRVDGSGDVRTLSLQMLIGDEPAVRIGLVLDFANGSATLIDAYKLYLEADGASVRESLNVASISLNNATVDGIISGKAVLDDQPDFDFWVDTNPASVIEPELDVQFEMNPGYVVDEFGFAVRYVGVTEDSRCPPDVGVSETRRSTCAARNTWRSSN